MYISRTMPPPVGVHVYSARMFDCSFCFSVGVLEALTRSLGDQLESTVDCHVVARQGTRNGTATVRRLAPRLFFPNHGDFFFYCTFLSCGPAPRSPSSSPSLIAPTFPRSALTFRFGASLSPAAIFEGPVLRRWLQVSMCERVFLEA